MTEPCSLPEFFLTFSSFSSALLTTSLASSTFFFSSFFCASKFFISFDKRSMATRTVSLSIGGKMKRFAPGTFYKILRKGRLY
jgi:hypothetical protein